MSWEIWQYTSPAREKIEHVFRFASDEQAAKRRFEEFERTITTSGGTYELRHNGRYLAFISCQPPERKVPAND